jgi:hypothetical protein
MALREDLWSARRRALEARESRERAELDAHRLLERAEEGTHRQIEARQEEDRARRKRAGLAARLKSAEDTLRLTEAQHASARAAAHRLSRLAGEAAERQAKAELAEEEALAEVARIDHELRRAELLPPATPVEVKATGFETGARPARPFLTSLVIGGVAMVVVVTAWTVGGSSDADPGAAERSSQPNHETTSGAVVPDAEGQSALDARRSLAAAGLSLAGVVPTVGTPGEVVRSVPAAGRNVTPGTPVTLYIGVEVNRYQRETFAFTGR